MFVCRFVFRFNENKMKIFITKKYNQMTATKCIAMHSLGFIMVLRIAGNTYL
jgi:hypothetical protein